MRERCTPSSARSKSVSATKSRSAHRVERVLEAAVEAELGRDEVGVERQGRPGERARAERRDVQPVHGGQEPVDVARERPAVRQQVMRQQHRLRPLHVGVAGQVDVAGLRARCGQRVLERHDLRRPRR